MHLCVEIFCSMLCCLVKLMSHPGTLCESVLDAIRPVSSVPGAQRGPKRGPKMRIVTFWPFRAPKRPRGRSSSKHKIYLRYWDSLWRFNWDLIFTGLNATTHPPTDTRVKSRDTSASKNLVQIFTFDRQPTPLMKSFHMDFVQSFLSRDWISSNKICFTITLS